MTLQSTIKESIEEASGDVSEINQRTCSSENYEGIEFRIYGNYVPIRPIIELFADKDDYGIETIGHFTDGGDPNVSVFVAEPPESEHPAFLP